MGHLFEVSGSVFVGDPGSVFSSNPRSENTSRATHKSHPTDSVEVSKTE